MNLREYFLLKIFLLGLILLNCVKCNRLSPVKGRLVKKRDVSFFLPVAKNDWESFEALLKPICVKRVSGTLEIEKVKDYISSQMNSYGWDVELDTFQDQTPYGKKSFTNIIATLPIGQTFRNVDRASQKDAYRLNHINNRLVVACHYDSKFFSDFDFIGAIDSAVPCALMLDIAKFLQEVLPNEPNIGFIGRHLQFMFFDGEEAFKEWTATDSLYGSRHYASLLHSNYSSKAFDSMDLFVLLDLIGGRDSEFLNYFPQTSHVYNLMAEIEKLLIKKGVLKIKSPYFFTDLNGYTGMYRQVDDDHKPFMKHGVPVLHLIPSPFPAQWHEKSDTLANLNKDRIYDLRLILKFFVLEVLHAEKKKPKVNEDEF